MNRKIAFDNRLCYERDVARQQALHLRKLEHMVPTSLSPSKVHLDNNVPSPRPHLATNAKKQQLERERQQDIYRQNQRLVSKMEHIMNRQENHVLAASSLSTRPQQPKQKHHKPKDQYLMPSVQVSVDETTKVKNVRGTPSVRFRSLGKSVHSPAHVHMPGIRIDATQTPLLDCYLSPEFAMNRGDACKKPSLVNRAVQKRRENAITEENRRLKERLTHLKPYYDTKKWDDEWHQHAHKFSHMHQDGTVGYLLPHTKMSAKGMAPSSRGMCRTSRVTPANASGLPSLGKTSKHNSIRADRPKEQSAKVCGPRGSGSRSDDSEASDEDAILQVRELEPCLLLEATTRSGVEVSVDELQIELTRSGIAELGDRGLMIRAAWKDGIRGELLVNIELLIQVAQVVDDLEIMIKLETVSHIPNAGNIPSLSTLLTDDELKKLLVGTVQQLRFQVSTTPPSAVSQSRLLISWGLRGSKIGVPDADNDKCNNSNSPRERLRPRTCPSTIASNHEQQQQHEDEMQDDYYEEDYNEYTGRSDIKTDMETRKLDWAAQLKAATILNMEGTRRRTVLRKGSVMYLVSSWFEEETSVQTIKAMGVGSTVADAGPLIVEISYNPREIEELLHQLDEGSLTVLAMIKKTVGPFLP